jgi:serine/threonine protein kinase
LKNEKLKSSNSSMTLHNFKILRIIGSGSFAVVKLAVNEETKQRVALKIYDNSKLSGIKRRAVE